MALDLLVRLILHGTARFTRSFHGAITELDDPALFKEMQQHLAKYPVERSPMRTGAIVLQYDVILACHTALCGKREEECVWEGGNMASHINFNRWLIIFFPNENPQRIKIIFTVPFDGDPYRPPPHS